MGSPGRPTYGKPSTSEADDWLRAQGWPLGAATYETYQAGAPLTAPLNQAPMSPAGEGASLADGSTNPLQTQAWPVGPVPIIAIALSLGAIGYWLYRKLRGQTVGGGTASAAAFGAALLVPVATYPFLGLLGITTIEALTANILFSTLAINSLLQLSIFLVLGACRRRTANASVDAARGSSSDLGKFTEFPLRIIAGSIGVILVLYWVVANGPDLSHRPCHGKCMVGTYLFGRRDNIFSTVWATNAFMSAPFCVLFLTLARALKLPIGFHTARSGKSAKNQT